MEGGEEEQELPPGAGAGRGRGQVSVRGLGGARAAAPSTSGFAQGRGSSRGVPKNGIGKNNKRNDLKNYFTSLSVGSSSSASHASTHESGNATTSTAGEVVQENEAMQSVATDLAHIEIGAAQPPEPEQLPQEEPRQEEEAMHFIKAALRNRIDDEWLNNIEKGIFKEFGIDKVKKRFQSMKIRRRMSLPKSPRRHQPINN